MNVLTSEAENGFMKDEDCKIFTEFHSQEVTATIVIAILFELLGLETNLKIESEEMIKWNKVKSVLLKSLHERGRGEPECDWKEIWDRSYSLAPSKEL